MPDKEKIIGIDLVRIDGENGIYGIYESANGGEEWRKLAESQKIYELIQFAKTQFATATPMIIPPQIQNLLTYEIMGEAEELKRKKAQAKASKINWLAQLLLYLHKLLTHRVRCLLSKD